MSVTTVPIPIAATLPSLFRRVAAVMVMAWAAMLCMPRATLLAAPFLARLQLFWVDPKLVGLRRELHGVQLRLPKCTVLGRRVQAEECATPHGCNRWRLDVFFVISGVVASLATRRWRARSDAIQLVLVVASQLHGVAVPRSVG